MFFSRPGFLKFFFAAYLTNHKRGNIMQLDVYKTLFAIPYNKNRLSLAKCFLGGNTYDFWYSP